jgi:hypothetical protein
MPIKQGCKLTSRASTCLHNAAASILAAEVERVLADIDADYGDFAIEFLGHGVLLRLRCPLPGTYALAGREHGRTIPLADIRP